MKTRHNYIQYLVSRKTVYTAIIKSVLLKWIPLQVPLKIFNFSNNYTKKYIYIFSGCFSYFTFYMLWGDYILENNIFYWKSSTRINSEKIQKMFKNTTTWLLLTCAVVSCISHAIASGKVLPRVVKFYWEIFYKSHLSNVSRRLLLKSPQNNQSFLIQSKVSKHYGIYGIFSNFLCILLLPFNFLGITWESQKSWWVIFQAFTEPRIQ